MMDNVKNNSHGYFSVPSSDTLDLGLDYLVGEFFTDSYWATAVLVHISPLCNSYFRESLIQIVTSSKAAFDTEDLSIT
jgi:hypothetical protein